MSVTRTLGLLAVATMLTANTAQATIRITEWMYDGAGREIVELTNMSGSPVDMTGYRYTDDARDPATAGEYLDLSAFGILQPGEVAIIAEEAEATFRALWFNMPASTKVIGGNTINLGRNDEINIYLGPNDPADLVDRLDFSDVDFPGTPRTQARSGNPSSPAVLPLHTVGVAGDWILSADGDSFGSYISAAGDVGNPGVYVDAVPEPATILLAIFGLAGAASRRRRR